MTNQALYLLDRQAIADALYARAETFQAGSDPKLFPQDAMIDVTNILCEFPSEDVALVESYFVAWPHAPATDGEPFGGRCLDRFERRNGDWEIAHTDVVFDWSDFGLHGGQG